MDRLVKSVAVRLSEDGADAVKLKIDRVAVRAEELKKIADDPLKLRVDTAEASIKLAIFREELKRTARDASSAGGGGLLGGLLGGLGKRAVLGKLGGGISGLFGSGGPAGTAEGAAGSAGSSGASGAGGLIGTPVGAIGGVGVAAAAITGLAAGVGGIIPLLASAGIGVGAFGALAAPTFLKITAALSGTKGAMDKLDPAQRTIVKGVQGVEAEFGKLAVKLEPLTTKIAGVGVSIASKLLPALLPFAQTAGKAILGLAQGFDKFASSPGFKTFLSQMERLAGPAITTIGQGLGRLGIAAGKLLEALINPNGLRFLRITFTTVEWVIQGTAKVIAVATPIMIRFFDNVANSFRSLGHWAVDAWHISSAAWNGMTGGIRAAAGFIEGAVLGIGRTIGGWASGVNNAVGRVVGWFGGLPGRITGALGDLGSLLFSAGKAILGGLLSGLEASWSSVAGFLGGLAHKITSLKGPLPKDAVMLYPHGQAIMGGLLRGMASQMPALTAFTSQASAVIGGGYGYAGGRSGAASVTYHVNVAVPPNANMAEVGRATVTAIKAFEKGSGASWRR